MITHNVQQGTPEWDALRRGRFTASTFADLFMGKSTAGYNERINQAVFERITGTTPDSFTSSWMQRGIELEPEAIEKYSLQTFNYVERIGFVEMSPWIGCSPDGFIDKRGTIQVKCPKFNTLITYLLDGNVPKNYMYQIQGELWICERDWSDFWVYHPNMRSMLVRVNRDDKMIAEIQARVDEAIDTAQERLEKIKTV